MTVQLLLTDIATDTTLLDLTPLATFTVSERLNRPQSIVANLSEANTASLLTAAADGDPRLHVGTRALKFIRGGTVRGHNIIWNLDYSGDPNNTTAQITAYDTLVRLRTRPVRDSTGNFSDPDYASPISGAAIFKDAVDNSVTYEGPLPINTASGTFNTTIPPAIDLSATLTDWPIPIGDLHTLLTDTGQVDIVFDPVDTSGGFSAGTMAKLSVLNKKGSDLTASVHLDYATGSHSIASIRRSFDMDELANKLWYYLGPRSSIAGDVSHWAGNITPPANSVANGGSTTANNALETARLASVAKYGTYMTIKIFDSGDENTVRPLFTELWKEDLKLRIAPRELLYVTPSTDAPFVPYDNYTTGDVIALNSSAVVGPSFTSAAQRVYGFDLSYSTEGTETVGELIVSADAE